MYGCNAIWLKYRQRNQVISPQTHGPILYSDDLIRNETEKAIANNLILSNSRPLWQSVYVLILVVARPGSQELFLITMTRRIKAN